MVENSVLRSEISKMLSGADLNAITSKKVRTELERTLGVGLADRKAEIEEAIRSVLDALNKPDADESSSNKPQDADDSDSSLSDLEDSAVHRSSRKRQPQKRKSSGQPPAKKVRQPPQQQLSDEELARQLHAKENGLPRRAAAAAGSGGGGGGRRKSGGGGGGGTGGFSKPCALSPELASVMGCDSSTRQQVVKRLWDLAKERNLFDPKNRQFVICDADFETLFNKKRLRMFSIMKYLKKHVISE